MKKKSFTKRISPFVVDLILIPIFACLLYSGLKLHETGHTYNHDTWVFWAYYHIIAAVLFLIIAGWHIKGHEAWYRSLIKKGVGKKSRITIVLTLLFLIEVLTGIILILFVNGANSPLGLGHYKLGLIMALLVLIHLVSRFTIMIKGLGWRKKKKKQDTTSYGY